MPHETVVDLVINNEGLCHLTNAPNELNHDTASSFENGAKTAHQEVMQSLHDILLPSSPRDSQEYLPSRTSNTCVALLGIPGIGKPEVAAAYIFPRTKKLDAVFWLQADTTKKASERICGGGSKTQTRGSRSRR